MILLLPLLLHISSADYLSEHLTSNVNVSIHPCDNFFLHVCSQSIDKNEFPFEKIKQFYANISKKYEHISNSSNLALLNDIAILQGTTEDNKPIFNMSSFRELVEMRHRCADVDDCYRKEFLSFFKFYVKYSGLEATENLEYFANKTENKNKDEILNVMQSMANSIQSREFFEFGVVSKVKTFYSQLTNRLFVMEQLKDNGIFEKIPNMNEDITSFKGLIIEKFRKTPWLNDKDNLGLSSLEEFEDKINDLVVYYDLDENDRDLALLRKINRNFLQTYYNAKQRTTGLEVLDIVFALFEAYESLNMISDPEENVLVDRVGDHFQVNAAYFRPLNRVAVLAPYIYPKLTDDVTYNKPYDLFQTIGHEILHSVIVATWAERSDAFENQMKCYNDHFKQTCKEFGEPACNSGSQTFEEDGPDVEGLRIAYEWLHLNYDDEELEKVIFKSDSLSVNRKQAFFYLYALSNCETIKPEKYHFDVHSYHQVRVNGDMMLMPEFSQAFSCSSEQEMFSTKEDTCYLFGLDSK